MFFLPNSTKNEFVRSFFGRIRWYQKSFRNYLTFNQDRSQKKNLFRTLFIITTPPRTSAMYWMRSAWSDGWHCVTCVLAEPYRPWGWASLMGYGGLLTRKVTNKRLAIYCVLQDFITTYLTGTQGDLTPIFPTFSNPILNLNIYTNADLEST